MAIRKSEHEPIYLYDNALGKPTLRRGPLKWDRGDESDGWQPILSAFGEYKGIEIRDGKTNLLYMGDGKRYIKHYSHQSFGAGIIGQVPYVLLNSGQNEKKMDGLNRDHRRWAQNVLRDFMCIKMPTLPPEVAKIYADIKSPIKFKQDEKCLSCHVTLDHLAGLIKNVELYNTAEDGFTTISVRSAVAHKIENNSKEYYNSPIRTDLVLMENNQLKKIPFHSLDEFGKWIASDDRFYQCQSQKIFSYLTGYDFADDPKKEDPKVIKFIRDEAKNLKEKNYQTVFMNIVKSEYF